MMTKQEARNFVREIKVFVKNFDESVRVQKKLFKLGCRWDVCTVGPDSCLPRFVHDPFLFVWEDMMLAHSNQGVIFATSGKRAVDASEIINLEWNEEGMFCKVKPFTKVLVRDEKTAEWEPELFARYHPDRSYPYEMIGPNPFTSVKCYRYCILYEGNEELAFTTKSPNRE